MSTNYPSATPQQQPPQKDSKNLIIALLAVAILATWGYFLWDKNKSEKDMAQLQSEYLLVDSTKNELEKSYSAAIVRLDSLTNNNNELEGQLTERNNELTALKKTIKSYLDKQRLSDAEKKQASALIKQLNEKINGLQEEVARLTAENKQLNTDLSSEKQKTTQLSSDLATTTTQKKQLENKVDIASTFNASGFAITPVNEKRSGRERETSRANRVDKLIISFDVENRIAASGSTDVFVCITDPTGVPVSIESLGSGRFQTREEGEKLYAAKVSLDYEAGKKKHVEFAWKQNEAFKKGGYKIEIFHNGFKIGEGVRGLK